MGQGICSGAARVKLDKLDCRSLPKADKLKSRQWDLMQIQQARSTGSAGARSTRQSPQGLIDTGNCGDGGRKHGLEHLNQLGLISDKNLQGLSAPPPPQKKSEWKTPREANNRNKRSRRTLGGQHKQTGSGIMPSNPTAWQVRQA